MKSYFIIIFYFIFSFFPIKENSLKIDEYYNHYPTASNIYNYGFSVIKDTSKYLAANTPLPYFFSVIPAKLFNINISINYLRFVNIVFSFLSLLIIYKLFIQLKSSLPIEKSLIIFFYPYFLKVSFTYYMAIYGLFFYLLFLKKNESTNQNYLLSGIIISFAFLSQQFYLSTFFIAFYLLFKDLSKDRFFNILKFASPIVISVLLILILWKGLTPENYRFHGIGFDLTKITAILISIGITSLPFNIFYIYSLKDKPFLKNKNIYQFLLVLVLTIIFTKYFYPIYSEKGGYNLITGISFNFINKIEKFNYIISLFVKSIFIISAILFFYRIILIRNINIFNLKSFLNFNNIEVSIFLLSIGFVFNILLAERHLLPLIITILFYELQKKENKIFIRIILILMSLIGSTYFYYYLYLQQNFYL